MLKEIWKHCDVSYKWDEVGDTKKAVSFGEIYLNSCFVNLTDLENVYCHR